MRWYDFIITTTFPWVNKWHFPIGLVFNFVVVLICHKVILKFVSFYSHDLMCEFEQFELFCMTLWEQSVYLAKKMWWQWWRHAQCLKTNLANGNWALEVMFRPICTLSCSNVTFGLSLLGNLVNKIILATATAFLYETMHVTWGELSLWLISATCHLVFTDFKELMFKIFILLRLSLPHANEWFKNWPLKLKLLWSILELMPYNAHTFHQEMMVIKKVVSGSFLEGWQSKKFTPLKDG